MDIVKEDQNDHHHHERRKRLRIGLTVSGGVLVAGTILALSILLLFIKQKKKKVETAETVLNITSINNDLGR